MAMTGNMGIAAGLIIGIVLLYIILFGLAIAEYILNALGLYRIAVRRQVGSPIMAWFPVVNDLLLGKVVETYDASLGHQRKWSNVLLVLNLCTIGSGIIFGAGYGIFLFSMITAVSNLEMMIVPDVSAFTFPIVGFVFLMIACILVGILSLAYGVCRYIAIYKLIESSESVKTIKHFLLSILVPLAYGIILLKYAKKFDQEIMERTEVFAEDKIPSSAVPEGFSEEVVDIQPQTLELKNDEYKVEEETENASQMNIVDEDDIED